jgi:glycerol-1-phosphatase
MTVIEIFESYMEQIHYVDEPKKTYQTSMSYLAKHYDHFLFDGFGTLYFEDEVFEDSVSCIQQLKKSGKQVRLVTNAASKTRLELSESLLGKGLGFHPNEIISSGSLLTTLNQKLGLSKAYHLGRDTALPLLAQSKISHSEMTRVVIMSGVPQEGFKEEHLNTAQQILHQPNATLILLNPDVIAPISSERYIEVAGFYANMLEEKTHCHVIRLGKPFPLIFEKTTYSFFPQGGSTVFIGDTLWTDIAGANHAGMSSALISRGNSRFNQFKESMTKAVTPDFILGSLKFD